MPINEMEGSAAGDGDELWMVVAVIQPFKLDAVMLALEGIPEFGGMTVTKCQGFGRAKVPSGRAEVAGAPRRSMDSGLADYTEKVKLEVAVRGREQRLRVVDTIVRTAHTGNRGDGKVFVWPFSQAVRIRTFETDGAAIGGGNE
ncbi:MAG TPA: P-II family nitrogen regulator [Gemmatimonadaceae bacterium]|nr:P-II family nitrogen regulator [Gemmatimonadaceae bacterium]